MSQTLANSIICGIRNDIELLQSMCGIYPGDPSGEITIDCMVMQEIIDTINEYNWDDVREELKEEMPKVTITYD